MFADGDDALAIDEYVCHVVVDRGEHSVGGAVDDVAPAQRADHHRLDDRQGERCGDRRVSRRPAVGDHAEGDRRGDGVIGRRHRPRGEDRLLGRLRRLGIHGFGSLWF